MRPNQRTLLPPAIVLAAVLIVAVGLGITLTALRPNKSDSFGVLPKPTSDPSQFGAADVPWLNFGLARLPTSSRTIYTDPVYLSWVGQWELRATRAQVFRYKEPTRAGADQFAGTLGASIRSRKSGSLGDYASTDFTLKVHGTVQRPPEEPYYVITVGHLATSDSGTGSLEVSDNFLAAHRLAPATQWTVEIHNEPPASDLSPFSDTTVVRYLRHFDVPEYGSARLIDNNFHNYGIEVDLYRGQPAFAAGPLPVRLESSPYRLVSSDQAVRVALASSAQDRGIAPSFPRVRLDDVELVYVLVPAGNYGYYEPAFVFSGVFDMNGTSYIKYVLVPAADSSQLNR